MAENPLRKQPWENINMSFFLNMYLLANPGKTKVQIAEDLNVAPITVSRLLQKDGTTPIKNFQDEWVPVFEKYIQTIKIDKIMDELTRIQRTKEEVQEFTRVVFFSAQSIGDDKVEEGINAMFEGREAFDEFAKSIGINDNLSYQTAKAMRDSMSANAIANYDMRIATTIWEKEKSLPPEKRELDTFTIL